MSNMQNVTNVYEIYKISKSIDKEYRLVSAGDCG